MRRLIYQAGQKPQQSWLWFRDGLLIFLIGAGLLYVSGRGISWLYWPGFIVTLLGFALSMRGYWGIFANRFARVLEQRQINQTNDPFADDAKKSNQE